MDEFDIIARYFEPLTLDRAEAGGLRDDAAVLKIPPGFELVVTSDTLNAGTHFLADEEPAFIAHKALRANLSDLAAMAAEPYAYQLCLALPAAPSGVWLAAFTSALLQDQKRFGIFCSGGDTTGINGPLSVTITAFGLVPEGKAVRRSGACKGDLIFLTGFVGDAWIGLQILQNRLWTENSESFVDRYRKPEPRTCLSSLLQRHARAAIDISDGLMADLGHLCAASGCGIDVKLDAIQFSPEARQMLESGVVTAGRLLAGGDDYELLIAVEPAKEKEFLQGLAEMKIEAQYLGRLNGEKGEIRILDKAGRPLSFKTRGWSHF